LINLLYGDLIGFCVSGGPTVTDEYEAIDKFEQARYVIATPSYNARSDKWAHDEVCGFVKKAESSGGKKTFVAIPIEFQLYFRERFVRHRKRDR
jgi:hypothetical protein